jgi:hypothetical protein
MRPLPVLRPLPWVIALASDLSDGLPRPRRELTFLPVERIAEEQPRVMKEAA